MTTSRGRQILARFPAHLEAARPGKLLGQVVDALAVDLDVLSARMAAVRRAHRLAEADELADLLRIAARHGIRPAELDIAFERFARAGALAQVLAHAATPAARNSAAEALLDLWGLGLAHPRLPRFAPAAAPNDLAAAASRLLSAARAATTQAALLDALRRRIARICVLHAAGNGTVAAVMQAAANALDLRLGPLVHSPDRYWHAAPAQDLLVIAAPADGPAPAAPLPPAQDTLGLEENPLWRMVTDSLSRRHAETWSLVRRGFERSLLQVRIRGADQGRSVGPMLVNRDEGHGVGLAGVVPSGQTLVFTEEGRALLDGADVTSLAYAWRGGCFAGADRNAQLDFCFDGPGLQPGQRPASFVATVPPGALDREASFPHDGQSLPMPGIAVGTTRLAYFVQQAHAASLDAPHGSTPAAVRSVTPRTRAAVFEASVWAPGPAQAEAVAGEVSLSWMERRAFAARLLIPGRFRALRKPDDLDATGVLRRVARALDRFRPAGVALSVEFIDDRWVLGQGQLPAAASADPITALRAATALWQPPAAGGP